MCKNTVCVLYVDKEQFFCVDVLFLVRANLFFSTKRIACVSTNYIFVNLTMTFLIPKAFKAW